MLSEKKKNRCAADSGSSSYSVFRTAKQILPMQRQSRHFLPRITASVLQMGTVTVPQSPKPLPVHSYHLAAQGKPQSRPARQAVIVNLRQHRTIPALRLKHRFGSCGTASALPKCSIMSGLFKKKTGHSPLTYFNLLKIQQSCQLLDTTDMKINQICYKIGIEDTYYFSRLFSKIMGMSPREYRKSKKG